MLLRFNGFTVDTSTKSISNLCLYACFIKSCLISSPSLCSLCKILPEDVFEQLVSSCMFSNTPFDARCRSILIFMSVVLCC